jgi:ligand-binding sensor domain-containing protein
VSQYIAVPSPRFSVTITATVLALLTPLHPTVCQSARWRPEDRVLISDFSYVEAVAVSPFTVFAATTRGLTIYDRQARTWRLPVTSLDGYPAARVRVALADGVDNAVWLGTTDGWARYDATVRTWEQGFVPGGVVNLMFDARDPASGIFVQGAIGWGFLPRGALVPVQDRPLPPPGQRVEPLDPRAALNQAPMADALRALILTDPRLRSYRFTAAARSPDRSELFLGSDGMGLIRLDPMTGEWSRLTFGLLATRAGAVATAPGGGGAGGAWVASAGRVGERRGLTWVAADLSADTAIEGAGTLGFPCVEGRRLIASGRSLWLACERGVVRIDAGGSRIKLFELDNPLALAPAPDGVWVGTARGLFVVTSDEKVVPIGPLRQPVLSLVAVRESLWVGTSGGGLGLVVPGTTEVIVPPDVADQPALRAPIVALALVRDTLAAVTSDQFAWRDPATRRWTLQRARADLGRVTALAGDAGGVWIGGTNGLTFWDIPHATFRTLAVPLDLPSAVRDVAVDRSYVWVATDSGLVRLARDAALR